MILKIKFQYFIDVEANKNKKTFKLKVSKNSVYKI